MLIPKTLSQVSKISTLATDASATVSVAGGNTMVWAGVGAAKRGKPFTIINVDENYETQLGTAYHMSEGPEAEVLRHVRDAVVGGNGKFVRVLPSTARYPLVTLRTITDPANVSPTANTAGTVVAIADSALELVKTALPYGVDVIQDEDIDLLTLYLEDGDNELERMFSLTKADETEYGADFYELTLFEKDTAGVISELESHIVSMNLTATNNQGYPAFIQDVLERDSKRIKPVVNQGLLDGMEEVEAVTFVGGTSGKLSDLVSDDYLDAIKVLRREDPDYEAVCALGIYDDFALQALAALAEDARVSLYYDIEPNLSYEDALQRQTDLGISTHFASCYHIPYSAKDPFYGSRANWGLSGFVFAAKAAGVASKGPTGGWHIVPAGMDRATISRSTLRLNANAGDRDEEAMVKKRINKLGFNSQGQLMIDDCLTCRAKNDYLRFENQTAVDNAIQRDWYRLALQFKHEPDDVVRDGLTNGMNRLLRGYEIVGGLVPSLDDGRVYEFRLTKAETDLWVGEWDISISGVMRRATGQCKLLR
ncbi:hypothetical protein NTE19_003359 [Vibrio fluvialis]|nr:hypothetical protein [Vibrio fluvialis]